MSILATELELETHLQRAIPADLAALALAGASGIARGYCGWEISRETTTFIVDTDRPTYFLTLPTLHLVSVAEVRINGVIDDRPLTQVTMRGQLAGPWPAYAKVEVDATHGYTPTPDVVRLVVLTVAARIVNNPDDVKQASVSSVSRTYDTSLSALELRLLDPYRL